MEPTKVVRLTGYSPNNNFRLWEVYMRQLVPDLMLLFDGDRHTYGTYGSNLMDKGGGKMVGKPTTVKGEVTIELWIKHLTGQQGLGIIPIDDTSRVKFAAIDIDEYPIDHRKLCIDIERLKLPLVVCRTKSGGAHLYLFLDTYYPAVDVQSKMRDMAALLGWGNSEIFPKQTKIVAERGDIGSWINMPYFDSTNTTRWAHDTEGNPMKFAEFVPFAISRIVSYAQLNSTKSANNELLRGGPPCLNHLVSMGFPQGTRNNGLFNIAVYCKKAYGDEWETFVQEYNGKYMDPPLEASEVQGIIKSVEKKEFIYTCKQAPISNYCNMPKCRACKYGIGMGDAGMPKFGSLTKIKSQPPIWFLEVEGGGRLELTTDDLQSPRGFQNRCMEVLNVMPILPKSDVWQEIIHKLLQEVNEVDVPEEATPAGMLWQHLEDFCTSRVQAKVADELLLGKPWLHNNFYYFRLRDFLSYLDRQKFKALPLNHVAMHLSEWKLGKKFWNLKGKGCNCYVISEKEFQKQQEPFEVPEIHNPEKVLT